MLRSIVMFTLTLGIMAGVIYLAAKGGEVAQTGAGLLAASYIVANLVGFVLVRMWDRNLNGDCTAQVRVTGQQFAEYLRGTLPHMREFVSQVVFGSVFSKWGDEKMLGAYDALGLEDLGGLGSFLAGVDKKPQQVLLSHETAHSRSAVALSVVAHEFGHVIQHLCRFPMKVWQALLGIALYVAPAVSIVSLIAGAWGGWQWLLATAVVASALSVAFMAFHFVVEVDAWRRGWPLLDRFLIRKRDRRHARRMMVAALSSYLGMFVGAIGLLLMAYGFYG